MGITMSLLLVMRAMPAGVMSRWRRGMCGQRNRKRGGVPEVGRKHHDQRRDHAKSEERVQRGQDACQVAGCSGGELPGYRPGSQSREGRDGA